jgi:HEAT repeat protein
MMAFTLANRADPPRRTSRCLRPVLLLLLCALGGWPRPSGAQEEAPDELVTMVLDLLKSDDRELRGLALEQVRSGAAGAEATQKFAAQLSQLPVETQVALLAALADRADIAARGAVLEQLQHDDVAVRAAAIGALGTLGQPDDLARLVAYLGSRVPEEQQAARVSLVRLSGDSVAASIARSMEAAPTPLQVALIEILAQRRALESIAPLLEAAVGSDSAVRQAAMKALSELAGPEHLDGLLRGVLRADGGSERELAEKAVMFVCQRVDDDAQRDAAVAAALAKFDAAEKVQLLPTLGRIGGSVVQSAVRGAIASRDAAEHAAGVRALANWPDASVAPELVALVEADAHPGHRTTALRALVRVAPLPDERPDTQRLELLQQAMSMCERDAERELVIRRARAVRIPETLRFVLPYLDQPSLSEAACESIVELAHHRALREAHRAEFHQALDRVIATTRSDTIRDRAERYKRNQTWTRRR